MLLEEETREKGSDQCYQFVGISWFVCRLDFPMLFILF